MLLRQNSYLAEAILCCGGNTVMLRRLNSNVVEAMLRLGNIDQRHQIVQDMLNVRIITSYVVKIALEVLEGGKQNYQLFSELLSNLGELVRLLLLVPDKSKTILAQVGSANKN